MTKLPMKYGSTLDLRLISELRLVKDFAAWRLCYIRAWYRWCAARDLPQFSNEIAGEIGQKFKIPGNPKGVAVRTRDPEQGALDELETVALVTKLKEIGPLVLSASERALVWLALAFGSNPLAFALLREEDFEPTKEIGTDRIHHLLKIPRIKKRNPFFRATFHTKRPNHVIGGHIAALIKENVEFRRKNGWPRKAALFRCFVGSILRLGCSAAPCTNSPCIIIRVR